MAKKDRTRSMATMTDNCVQQEQEDIEVPTTRQGAILLAKVTELETKLAKAEFKLDAILTKLHATGWHIDIPE